MTEDEFLARWRADVPVYEAWGLHVAERVQAALAPMIAPVASDVFLRIPPKPRTKGEVSFLEKAFYRKAYADPYVEVTDKVGVRFVVLVASQIQVVEKALLTIEEWHHSKDKDFEAEQANNPLQFTYAAVHYVVSPKSEVGLGDLIVPAGAPCEIQIKTILQHAYSEITHDTIYKPRVNAAPQLHRAAAKSMALIEATNDYFEQVLGEVTQIIRADRTATDGLVEVYRSVLGVEASPSKAEGLLLGAYDADVPGDLVGEVRKMLGEHPYIAERIRERSAGMLLFRQPSILLAYWLALNKPVAARARWPLPQESLRPIFTDVGRSFDAY